MAIRKVAHLGHPVLRRVSERVDPQTIGSRALQQLIDDLIDTMREYDGVGLAAPQIHESHRIVVYEIEDNPRYPDAPSTALTILVNPVVTPLSDEVHEDWEGCLSLPDLRGLVPRHAAVEVDALDRYGRPQRFTAKDFHARVIQHECDHLDAKVFIDRMRDFSSLAFLPEFLRYAGVEGDVRD